MKTEILSANATNAITRALEVLLSGKLVAFPTDTVYGVGVLAFHAEAIESIYIAKNRPMEKAIPVLIGDVEDLIKVANEIPIFAGRLIARFWPGPLTVLVPKKPTLPEAISATSTIGVRVPNHDIARSLLRLGGRIPLILDGGETPGGIPSTLADCTGDQIEILREGPITKAQLISAI